MSASGQQSQIKALIVLGKEQGFLTLAEVSDHLTAVVDAEQVEDVISVIRSMGIPVHEEAPDAETRLFSEPVATAAEDDDEAAEEAAAALAAANSEFGRTTDPVRMYMREMGSVELLDREGEIVIAKRIEEGLNEALLAIAGYPHTVTTLLEAYDAATSNGKGLAEVIVGFFDPNAEPIAAVAGIPEDVIDEGVGEAEDEEAAPAGPDPVQAAAAFAELRALYSLAWEAPQVPGASGLEIKQRREALAAHMMTLKLSRKVVAQIKDNLRGTLNQIRALERAILNIAVEDAGMNRAEFLANFFEEGSAGTAWLDKAIRGKRKFSAKLASRRGEITALIDQLKLIESARLLSIE
ncbi:MAG: RNA polymerase sigma factor RpoD, partial [Nevskia sp.]|nr:RNA polymerase sigma factor RpoD [Nevskia sp.]